MQREILYLRDIVEAAESIGTFLTGIQKEHFVGNDLLRSAVLQKLAIMGEAAACLRKSLESKYPHIPWKDIVRFRNIAIHAYFGIQWDLIWEMATRDAPALKDEVRSILARDYAGPP